MRLNEISDEEKLVLSLKGIQYDFTVDYQSVVMALALIGKSLHRRNILYLDIDHLMSLVTLFLNQGFDETDPDVIFAGDLYDKLLAIKNQI